METVFSYGTIELENTKDQKLKVNGQRVKHYLDNVDKVKFIYDIVLSEV